MRTPVSKQPLTGATWGKTCPGPMNVNTDGEEKKRGFQVGRRDAVQWGSSLMDKNLDFFFSPRRPLIWRDAKWLCSSPFSKSVLGVVGRLHGHVKWEMVVRKGNPLQQTWRLQGYVLNHREDLGSGCSPWWWSTSSKQVGNTWARPLSRLWTRKQNPVTLTKSASCLSSAPPHPVPSTIPQDEEKWPEMLSPTLSQETKPLVSGVAKSTEEGLPWWSRGLDAVLPVQGIRVRSLVRN